jgi:SAM-dependent methyltransferase
MSPVRPSKGRPMAADRMARKEGKQIEIDFWSRWFETKGLEWKKEYRDRLDPNLLFQDYLIKYLPKSPVCTILDVGAGPLTALGKKLTGCEIAITAVDPLAREYEEILERFNISPVVKTQYCEAEKLSENFLPDYFDFVHVLNAMDHSYDPIEGMRQMLKVVKKNCFIFMSHASNEAEKENYIGFHQWNFCREGDKFIVWNKDIRIDVNEELKNLAEITIRGDQSWNIVEMRRKLRV